MNAPDPAPADLIRPARAAQLLHVHICSLYRWIAAGKLRAWRRAGRRYVVSEADVKALLEPVVPREPAAGVETRAQRAARAAHAEEVLKAAGYKL